MSGFTVFQISSSSTSSSTSYFSFLHLFCILSFGVFCRVFTYSKMSQYLINICWQRLCKDMHNTSALKFKRCILDLKNEWRRRSPFRIRNWFSVLTKHCLNEASLSVESLMYIWCPSISYTQRQFLIPQRKSCWRTVLSQLELFSTSNIKH